MTTQTTLETLFAGKAATRVLLFIENYGEGYANQISKTFEMPLSEVQKQLTKFENAGVLVSRTVGTSRIYYLEPSRPGLRRPAMALSLKPSHTKIDQLNRP